MRTWLVLVFVLLTLCCASLASHPSNCTDTGPPYLLITFHDVPSNVMKFTTSGCLLGGVLVANSWTTSGTQMRGMTLHDDGQLFVAQTSGKDDLNCSVAIYSTCQPSLDTVTNRLFVSTAVQTVLNPGLVHPYGVVLESRASPLNSHWLYVSSQHTDNVLRFFPAGAAGTLYQPAAFPSAVVAQLNAYNMFYGTFVQYGPPGIHDSSQQGVRDIELVPGSAGNASNLWVANEDLTAVEIYDTASGQVVAIFPTTGYHPVGLYYDAVSGMVFVGGSPLSGQGDGIIWGVDASTVKIRRTYTAAQLNHPAGMVTLAGLLYVIEQDNDQLITFDVDQENLVGVVVPSFSDLGFSQAEQLVLSDC